MKRKGPHGDMCKAKKIKRHEARVRRDGWRKSKGDAIDVDKKDMDERDQGHG